ncbi:ABC transporter substrate-binding protein [Rhodospirillaceae bacterium SYSU D60014]|uniref:MlaC/ttg2D family ABC transporter substrate-binding protein n=1 Tax=Virgifigura deserti TaxID=2268457 RepID=UPI000E672A14
MLSRRDLLVIPLAFATLGIGAVRAGQSGTDAKSFIENLGAEAVEALTGPDLPQDERERRFSAMLNRYFDLPGIGKFVLGRYWRSASEAERQDFLRLFEDFIVKSYAARFAEYSGEQFRVLGVRNEGDYATVQSLVIRPGAEDVRVDWRLRDADGLKIIDIMVEGVSMVITQRADFASVIQSRGGVAGLLDMLRQKTSS